MKKTSIFSLLALGVVALATSCRDKAVEIVEQDPSYTLDANVISVDIPKPFIFNENNIVRYNGSTELIVSAKVDLNSVVTMTGNTIDLSFTLRRALAAPTEFVLEEDRSLLDQYRGVKTDFRELPENSVEGLRFTIPQGVKTFSTRLTIQNSAQLTHVPGYLTAYRLRPVQDGQKLEVSEATRVLYLKVRVKQSPLGSPTNATLTTGVENSWILLTNGQMNVSGPGTTYSPVTNLIDGTKGSAARSWSTVIGSSSNVIFTFFKPRTVAGIVIHSRYAQYGVKRFRIEVAEDETTWSSQGEITNTGTSAVYVKFATPVETNKVRLSMLEALQSDRNVYMEEIEVYTLD